MTSDDLYRTVMTVDPPAARTPFEAASRDFLFDQVWARPGLSIRDRRLVSIACVAAADAVKPIDDHVYAALRSGSALETGDVTYDEMQEIILHFSAYYGFAKGEPLHDAAQDWRAGRP